MIDSQKKKYVAGGGVECPYCGAKDIQGGSFDTEGGTVSQIVMCSDCDRAWYDVYKLTDLVEIECSTNSLSRHGASRCPTAPLS